MNEQKGSTLIEQAVLEVKKNLNADLEKVYEAWTSPRMLEKWWCTPGYCCEKLQIDLRPGGRYFFQLIPEAGQEGPVCTMEGNFTKVTTHELTYTWSIQAGDFQELDTTVHVAFISKDDQTDVLLTHQGFSSKASYDLHALDWPLVLENLNRLLGDLKTARP